MAIAVTNRYSVAPASATSNSITLNFTPAAGERLVMLARGSATGDNVGSSITQSGVTWTSQNITLTGSGANHTARLWYTDTLTTAAPTALTFATSGVGYRALHFFSLANAVATGSPFAGTPVGQQSGFGSSATPTSFTPSLANCLVIAGYQYPYGASSSDISGGFTLNEQLAGVSNRSRTAELIQTAPAAANPALTLSGSSQWSAVIFAVAPLIPAAATHGPPLTTDPDAPAYEWELTQKSVATYGDEAVARLVQQFRSGDAGPLIQGYVRYLAERVGECESVAWDVYSVMDPDVATGVHLDKLGRFVGQLRQGRTDAQYRIAIKARIAVNRSSGTLPELINILRLLVGEAATITVPEYAAAGANSGTYRMNVNGADVLEEIAIMLGDATMAGVRGVITYHPDLATALILSDSTMNVDAGHGLSDDAMTDPGGTLAGLWEVH